MKDRKVHAKWPGLTTDGSRKAATSRSRPASATSLPRFSSSAPACATLTPVFPDYALAERGPALIA
jgi:hypothetical protein